MYKHELYLSHDRIADGIAPFEEIASASSTVTIATDSHDLVEAWSELLSRLPSDLYAGLKTAMEHAEK